MNAAWEHLARAAYVVEEWWWRHIWARPLYRGLDAMRDLSGAVTVDLRSRERLNEPARDEERL